MTPPVPRYDVDLLVVGAGPTGLTAAIAARQHGLTVRIVDRGEAATAFSKALVLHSRSLEVLDDLGCSARLLGAGRPFRALHIVSGAATIARVQFDELDWRGAPYPMWLTLPQASTERCLEAHLASVGTVVERTTTAIAVTEHEDGVAVDLVKGGNAERIQARWVLGADGARSDVRRLAGISLDGETGEEVFVLADVDVETSLPDGEGFNILAREGILLIVPLDVPGRVRLIAHLPGVSPDAVPSVDQELLQRLLDERCPVRATITAVGWTSHFVPKHLLARAYQKGRVFLAGDAAHLHSPVGGQGLNAGIQDAYNLVWKLGHARRGQATPALLASYGVERRAVAAKMVRAVATATRVLTVQSRLAQSARNRAARALLSRAWVRDRLGPGVGMLNVEYGASAAVADDPRWTRGGGPRPGARMPLLSTRPELSDAVRGPAHVLLFLDGFTMPFEEAASRAWIDAASSVLRPEPFRVVRVTTQTDPQTEAQTAAWPTSGPVVADPDGAVRRAFGAKTPTVLWVRPDKYVGFRAGPASAASLTAYLRAMFDAGAPR